MPRSDASARRPASPTAPRAARWPPRARRPAAAAAWPPGRARLGNGDRQRRVRAIRVVGRRGRSGRRASHRVRITRQAGRRDAARGGQQLAGRVEPERQDRGRLLPIAYGVQRVLARGRGRPGRLRGSSSSSAASASRQRGERLVGGLPAGDEGIRGLGSGRRTAPRCPGRACWQAARRQGSAPGCHRDQDAVDTGGGGGRERCLDRTRASMAAAASDQVGAWRLVAVDHECRPATAGVERPLQLVDQRVETGRVGLRRPAWRSAAAVGRDGGVRGRRQPAGAASERTKQRDRQHADQHGPRSGRAAPIMPRCTGGLRVPPTCARCPKQSCISTWTARCAPTRRSSWPPRSACH